MFSWPMPRRSYRIRTKIRLCRSWRWHGERQSICSTRRRRWRFRAIRMHTDCVTRRAILKSLTMGAVAGSVMRVIPLEAAEHAHHLIEEQKESAGAYIPKFFGARSYKTLQALCETILPADAD